MGMVHISNNIISMLYCVYYVCMEDHADITVYEHIQHLMHIPAVSPTVDLLN